MKRILSFLAVLNLLLCSAAVHAGIISSGLYADDTAFSTATGAVSLTGTLPDIGNQGTSVTLGDATLTAGNDIFVGSGWSTLMPGGNAIAISGPEHMDVSINTVQSTAFGFYFHEPSTDNVQLDGCNATCFDSTFTISFSLSGSAIDSVSFSPADDQLLFMGIVLDEAFDTVSFTETTGGIDNEFFGEMFIAKVPEPSTFALLFIGIAGLLLARRKQRS